MYIKKKLQPKENKAGVPNTIATC